MTARTSSMLVRTMLAARRRRGLTLAGVAAFTVLSLALCTRISFGTDVLALLPANSPALASFRQYVDHFGAANQLYILFEADDPGGLDDGSALIDDYLVRLRALPEIARVDAGAFDPQKDWRFVQERTFLLLGPDETRALVGQLDDAGIRASLARSRELLTTPSRDVQRLVQTDPLGWLPRLRDHFAGEAAFSAIDMTRQGYLATDGRSRLVIATPTGAPFDSAFARRLFDRLSAIEADARRATAPAGDTSGPSSLRIEYAGGHRIAVETESIIRREATLNGVTSLAAILVMLLVVFRSPWLFVVGALPMTVATIGSAGMNGLLHRQMSAAATGTSALLFGLGIDGLVLLYTRYLEERELGGSPEEAIARLGGAATSMMLGCLTTAATFLGLTWIDLPGLQELGRLVGVGMVLGAPLTLLLAAALFPSSPSRRRALTATGLATMVQKRRVPILTVAALLTVVALPLLARMRLDLRLERLQPDTAAVRLQQEIGRRFGVERDVALAVARGPALEPLIELDRTFSRELQQTAPRLSATGVSRLLPPAREQAATADVLRTTADALGPLQQRVRSSAETTGFRAGALDDFIARLPVFLDPSQRLTYDGFVEHGLSDVLSHFVVRTPDGFMTVAYVELEKPDDVAAVAAAVQRAGAPLVLTGLPVINAELAARFGPAFAIGIAAGAVAVFLLMLATFRRVGLTILALLPTLAGLAWAGALLAIFDQRLDLFSIFALLTLIGIGVDYGIHLVHRASADGDPLHIALSRIAPANLVAAGIALLGCGSLVTSGYPPLRSLGLVTVVGLLTCLLTSILVLPAALFTIQADDSDDRFNSIDAIDSKTATDANGVTKQSRATGARGEAP